MGKSGRLLVGGDRSAERASPPTASRWKRGAGTGEDLFSEAPGTRTMDETPIEIVEYDPEWPERFDAERDRLAPWIGEYTARIEHVGRPSVPGLTAKPIVDVTAVVSDLPGLWGTLDKLTAGFGYDVSHVPGDWLLLQRVDGDGQAYNPPDRRVQRPVEERPALPGVPAGPPRGPPGVRNGKTRGRRRQSRRHRRLQPGKRRRLRVDTRPGERRRLGHGSGTAGGE